MDPQVDALIEDLAREFEPDVSRDTVHEVVEDTLESMGDARIKSYVPVLCRRLARDRLRSLARRPA